MYSVHYIVHYMYIVHYIVCVCCDEIRELFQSFLGYYGYILYRYIASVSHYQTIGKNPCVCAWQSEKNCQLTLVFCRLHPRKVSEPLTSKLSQTVRVIAIRCVINYRIIPSWFYSIPMNLYNTKFIYFPQRHCSHNTLFIIILEFHWL